MLGIILFLAFMIVSLSIFLLRKPTNEKLYKLAIGSYIAFFLLFLTLFVHYVNSENMVDAIKNLVQKTSYKNKVEERNSSSRHSKEQVPVKSALIDAPLLSQLPELPRGVRGNKSGNAFESRGNQSRQDDTSEANKEKPNSLSNT